MEPKTYKLVHELGGYATQHKRSMRWYVVFTDVNGEQFSRGFASKKDTEELAQSLEDDGYTKED